MFPNHRPQFQIECNDIRPVGNVLRIHGIVFVPVSRAFQGGSDQFQPDLILQFRCADLFIADRNGNLVRWVVGHFFRRRISVPPVFFRLRLQAFVVRQVIALVVRNGQQSFVNISDNLRPPGILLVQVDARDLPVVIHFRCHGRMLLEILNDHVTNGIVRFPVPLAGHNVVGLQRGGISEIIDRQRESFIVPQRFPMEQDVFNAFSFGFGQVDFIINPAEHIVQVIM